VKGSPDNKNRDNKYDKIKHLVEVDDDILAVFSMMSNKMNELYIGKNSNIDKTYIDSLVSLLELNQTTVNENLQNDIGKEELENKLLGELKWIVMEYENLRILKIHESNKTVFVLIKSNTQLEHTVDNILGYYYELDEIPKSLF
jgi:hypothetical protein